MTDELDRTKEKLHLGGLVDPFFVSYAVADQKRLDISASYGALSLSREDHSRSESVRLLVNNYHFNDENFSDNTGFFSFSSAPDNTLPIDDDYTGIRRALWLSTDDLFKDANDNFTKKKAAFEHKQLPDDVKDLDDFAKVPAVQIAVAPENIVYDRHALEEMVKDLSKIFESYKDIQGSSVSLTFTDAYEFIQSSEGTKVRKPVSLAEIKVQATTQATEDGEPLALSLSAVGHSPADLPSAAVLHDRVKKLADDLSALKNCKPFDKEYTGPVVFESEATGDFLADNVVSRMVSKREDVLGNDVSGFFGSAKRASLKEKLNTRILPTSVSLTDAPSTPQKAGVSLLGAYAFDDEGVPPVQVLTLVDKGILKTLYMTRTPTKEVREPNGHARSMAHSAPGLGENAPAPGVVEYKDTKAMKMVDMKKDLFKRAKDDGYDYAYVVRSIQSSLPAGEESGFNFNDLLASGKLITPALMYRVYPDGREELVRGAEIGLPTVRDMRELITSKESDTRNMLISAGAGGLFNFSAKVPSTLIGPKSILCPELEVQKRKSSANPTLPVVERP